MTVSRGKPKPPTPTRDLNERVRQRILDGCRLDAALAAEGITDDIRRTWRILADVSPGGAHARFFGAMQQAFAEAECNLVKELREIAKLRGDPKRGASKVKALTWLLERTRRDNFGHTIHVKVEEAKEELLDRAQRALSGFPGAFEALIRALGDDGDALASSQTGENADVSVN